MRDLLDWLLDDRQEKLYEFLVALAVNLVFLVVSAFVLWPLGKAGLAIELARGFAVLWLALEAIHLLAALAVAVFRIQTDNPGLGYVLCGVIASGFLQMGWAAFAASRLPLFVAGASWWQVGMAYAIGAVSCYVAAVVIGLVYTGSLYRLTGLAIAALSFIVFVAFPRLAQAIFP